MNNKRTLKDYLVSSISNGMKKILFIAGSFLLFGIAPHVLAEEFVALAPIPGLTDPSSAIANSESLANFFNNLYKYLIGLAAALAVIEIIWGGLEIAVNKENVSKLTDAKGRIVQAIFGLVLVLSPVLVFSIINPSILNLSLNLRPLDTAPGQTLTTGSTSNNGSQTSVTAPSAGCTTGSSGPYLERAVCSSQNYASSYSCSNGLSPTIASCQTENASGNCVDASVTLYCGKSITVQYQKATHLFGIIPGWDSTVVPRDSQIQNAFSAGCTADGGTMKATITAAGAAFIASHSLSTYSWTSLTNGCSESMGVTYTTTSQYGVICYGVSLTCSP